MDIKKAIQYACECQKAEDYVKVSKLLLKGSEVTHVDVEAVLNYLSDKDTVAGQVDLTEIE